MQLKKYQQEKLVVIRDCFKHRLALLVFICVFLVLESNAENIPTSRTFILVNGQEREASLKNDVNVPVLVFGLHIGNDGKARIGLLEAFAAKGDRDLRLLKDYGMLLVKMWWSGRTAVFDLNGYGQKEWINLYNIDSMTVAKTIDGKGVFFANETWDNGEQQHVTFLSANHKSGKAVFLRDNIIIGERTMDDIMRGESFWIVYDKSTLRLARLGWKDVVEMNGSSRVHRCIQTCFPLIDDYPPALKETLSSPFYKDSHHRCCSMIRNDVKKRLIVCLNPAKNELSFYSYDHGKKEWKSMTFSDVRPYGEYGESWDDVLKWTKWQLDTLLFSGMRFSVIDSWLCQKRTSQSLADGRGPEVVFYSLPDLKERFRWTTVQDVGKLLYMKDGFMLFANEGEIWCANYDENGISNLRQLVRGDYLKGVRYAFEVSDGRLGESSKWQMPQLYPQSITFGLTDAKMEYYVTASPDTQKASDAEK